MRKIKSYSRISGRFAELGIPEVEIPNLLAMQVDSFNDFLQKDVHPLRRTKKGLQAVFESIFPIEDNKGNFLLEFIEYSVLQEKYTIGECRERNLSYQAPLKAKMRLSVFEITETGREHKDTLEQDVFLGEIPLVTDQGTFIVNGAERVIISQLQRSPGVFFSEEKHPSGKTLYSAKVIPYNGSWLEFDIDIHDVMFVHIDKRRKLPVTTLLRAIGISTSHDLRKTFYKSETVPIAEAKNRYLFKDIKVAGFDEPIAFANEVVTDILIKILGEHKIKQVETIDSNFEIARKVLENTIAKDPTTNQEEALKKIYSLIRPGEDAQVEAAQQLVDRMFFNEKRYNLGEVGRHKINVRLGIDVAITTMTLTVEDFVSIFKTLIDIYNDKDDIDDIDNLSNRRVRTVGELLQEQYNTGLSMVSRIIQERMAISNIDEITVHDLVNSNALINVVQGFFLTGQLSQFMEQTNPLAGLRHKRALSALGPGGLARDRAGFEVRDVHASHYGRVCPIETPEGPNIGLIVSPAIYSRINHLGFIETPYRRVFDSIVSDEYVYMDAAEEEKYIIAQSDVHLDDDRRISDEVVFAREKGDFIQVKPEEIEYMDVAPQQMVSVSAAMIPFLEHDDANRALMGSNMQRQAVPLINPQAPVVGTGMEKIVTADTSDIALAPYDAVVEHVTSAYIDLKALDEKDEALYLGTGSRVQLKKFIRTNQDTCANQRPTVKVGDTVRKGQPLSDGACVEDNRLALGTNMMVAFMPWYGYNYEDAIIISEKVAREDTLTSVYIEEMEVLVRNVKNGREELAYDIPNVPAQALRNLDKTGIVRVGSVIYAGDIIVGKVTPKSIEIDPSPEENLMRALFGDRAGDFTNSSLKAKPGMEGVVIDVKVFSRLEDGIDMDDENDDKIKMLKDELTLRRKKVEEFKEEKLSAILLGQKAKTIWDEKTNAYFIAPGKKINKEDLGRINFKKLDLDVEMVEDSAINNMIYQDISLKIKQSLEQSENIYKKSRERIKHGDELQYGVRKMVKVYVAKKRKIEVGDKMAGRHGNKGVISIIAPIEDMPFMEDGTPVDIALNPLGVPSRMNIGQIMETHLGLAARALGFDVETPIFDGASNEDIRSELKAAGYAEDGKMVLYDGKTGSPFKERVTVGVIYMMKLNHLVADKMHARSTGPYSLITQQPLGGKAQHGGQRLGEMEVWALEAYGAAHVLEEMLTIKSDDVDGRNNAFKAITRGENPPAPGVPESFNVLVSELKSLGFDIEFVKDEEGK
ncbi:MAG: DNA-directed RNA polymerase subunit beta [Candidatus Cloacimonetes bacterium]|nr:DNA-directed RNA polymerase subunit beta [Candidatus Cloacimonadota bacterium]MCB5287758.1 DNA-directed RNA polymerase subunit beta [Candidatus Cloacimonadota bacterium]MCK9184737.1 DNA-directed RNA polymerase subunit beta [Candidatus Cloacimonadota bacterium]MCK9584876.1 DNA-directed RNA polymerase subunit beta [Candidatus Cloacimonadota bacterium]MDY0230079.1 DNA-directed RNA polymerase subunit beta [Candidatus Cloacimonadaceae bacterium]